jgi:hypothetical protein
MPMNLAQITRSGTCSGAQSPQRLAGWRRNCRQRNSSGFPARLSILRIQAKFIFARGPLFPFYAHRTRADRNLSVFRYGDRMMTVFREWFRGLK